MQIVKRSFTALSKSTAQKRRIAAAGFLAFCLATGGLTGCSSGSKPSATTNSSHPAASVASQQPSTPSASASIGSPKTESNSEKIPTNFQTTPLMIPSETYNSRAFLLVESIKTTTTADTDQVIIKFKKSPQTKELQLSFQGSYVPKVEQDGSGREIKLAGTNFYNLFISTVANYDNPEEEPHLNVNNVGSSIAQVRTLSSFEGVFQIGFGINGEKPVAINYDANTLQATISFKH